MGMSEVHTELMTICPAFSPLHYATHFRPQQPPTSVYTCVPCISSAAALFFACSSAAVVNRLRGSLAPYDCRRGSSLHGFLLCGSARHIPVDPGLRVRVHLMRRKGREEWQKIKAVSKFQAQSGKRLASRSGKRRGHVWPRSICGICANW